MGMRRPKAGTNRSRSTEPIAALIARDPVRTDGNNVLYLHDPQITTLMAAKGAHEVQVGVLDKMV